MKKLLLIIVLCVSLNAGEYNKALENRVVRALKQCYKANPDIYDKVIIIEHYLKRYARNPSLAKNKLEELGFELGMDVVLHCDSYENGAIVDYFEILDEDNMMDGVRFAMLLLFAARQM